jgi:hypothetical protein
MEQTEETQTDSSSSRSSSVLSRVLDRWESVLNLIARPALMVGGFYALLKSFYAADSDNYSKATYYLLLAVLLTWGTTQFGKPKKPSSN